MSCFILVGYRKFKCHPPYYMRVADSNVIICGVVVSGCLHPFFSCSVQRYSFLFHVPECVNSMAFLFAIVNPSVTTSYLLLCMTKHALLSFFFAHRAENHQNLRSRSFSLSPIVYFPFQQQRNANAKENHSNHIFSMCETFVRF